MQNDSKLTDYNGTNVRINPLKKVMTYFLVYLLWHLKSSWVKRFLLEQFFIPRAYRVSDQETAFLQTAEKITISSNQNKIQCWQWGSGPLVIFVHGWNGKGIQFIPFLKMFSDSGYSVLTFDLPGHGESEGKYSNYFAITDSIRAILNHLDKSNLAGIIGHSVGAAAIINALDKEDISIPTVLIAPPLHLKEMLEYAFFSHGIPSKVFYSLITDFERLMGYNLKNDNPINLIKKKQLQALIIHDKNDKITSFQDSMEVSKIIPSLDLFPTAGLGHRRILFDEAVINKSLQYIENNPLRNQDSNYSQKILSTDYTDSGKLIQK
jgi:hypothetical protein